MSKWTDCRNKYAEMFRAIEKTIVFVFDETVGY